jgi:hypothetical protein
MSSALKTCESCRHFYKDPQGQFCRRYPPQAQMLTQQDRFGQLQMTIQSFSPPTKPENSCGEWAGALSVVQ